MVATLNDLSLPRKHQRLQENCPTTAVIFDSVITEILARDLAERETQFSSVKLRVRTVALLALANVSKAIHALLMVLQTCGLQANWCSEVSP
jgi:hypothetical protein